MAAKSVSVATTTTTTYNTLPEFDAGFMPQGHELYTTTATAVVAFSYDGINDHGRVDGANFKGISRTPAKYQRIWLRAVANGPATVVVSAWS